MYVWIYVRESHESPLLSTRSFIYNFFSSFTAPIVSLQLSLLVRRLTANFYLLRSLRTATRHYLHVQAGMSVVSGSTVSVLLNISTVHIWITVTKPLIVLNLYILCKLFKINRFLGTILRFIYYSIKTLLVIKMCMNLYYALKGTSWYYFLMCMFFILFYQANPCGIRVGK